ncbi:AI-2E family transporter [Chlorogloeopsis sp. ULAP01]|uniref:AI-2E family transporter n=1 Tax=Chlorogloeopsis sp. ULAP01 TaxID=3056483 RepID=UPI0025AB0959|nr:AI-2E family transporter [Chlorogloeopsis sp. ULAP01]MDM9383806.1 AI-2E family transporter [Chlorogloeopsis sp. ULAP01]
MSQSPKPNLWQKLNNSTLLRLLLLFACGWAFVILISYFYNVIAIFTTAAIVAALLNYPVQWLSRYVPRGLAIAIAFLGTIVILLTLVTALGLQVMTQGQGLVARITQALNTQNLLPLQEFLGNLSIERILQTLQTSLMSGIGIAQNVFSSVFTFVFLAVISLYMLIDGEKLWFAFLNLIPTPSRDRFANTFQRSFLGFLRGQLLLMLFLSTTSFLIFSILGVNYALFLAIIVGILDAIPGIGATLAVLIITLLILASQGWVLALKVVIACIILQQIQDNFVSPKVMGNALEISPVLLFFALFIGERIAGLLGVFLSIPIAGMIAAWLRADALETQNSLSEKSQELINKDL